MQYKLHVKVTTKEQIEAVLQKSEIVSRIYIPYRIFAESDKNVRIPDGIEMYLCSPYVFRNRDIDNIDRVLLQYQFDGYLCCDHEFFGYINGSEHSDKDRKLVLDSGMYILNHEALDLYIHNSSHKISGFYNSFELNRKELDKLSDAVCKHGIDNVISSYVVYGRIPMMISANCILKTSARCRKTSGFTYIKDRMGVNFPVFNDCCSCLNVIYNSVPLSLHGYFDELYFKGDVRIDLTDETAEQSAGIIDYFGFYDPAKKLPYSDYTTGHYKRGVE